MISRSLPLHHCLFLVSLVTACDLDPQPRTATATVSVGERVILQGQRVPAEDVYWTFSSHPVTTLANFTDLTWETAEFVPRVEGEFVIDRWAVSGPAGIWTDSFIITATQP